MLRSRCANNLIIKVAQKIMFCVCHACHHRLINRDDHGAHLRHIRNVVELETKLAATKGARAVHQQVAKAVWRLAELDKVEFRAPQWFADLADLGWDINFCCEQEIRKPHAQVKF